MRAARSAGQCLRRRLAATDAPLWLLLDFDGTLAPLADTPRRARLPRITRYLLRRLARLPRIKIAVISGRAVADLRRQVGIAGIMYAGNHGLEIEGPGFRWRHPLPRGFIRRLRQVRQELHAALGAWPGVLIEDKGLTLSVHVRLVRPAEQPALRRTARRIIERGGRQVRVSSGKKVIEVRPPVPWHKGTAARRILNHWRSRGGRRGLTVYIGDDRTDEDAFRVLRGRGITVRVGRTGRTQAAYRVAGPAQVRRLLEIARAAGAEIKK